MNADRFMNKERFREQMVKAQTDWCDFIKQHCERYIKGTANHLIVSWMVYCHDNELSLDSDRVMTISQEQLRENIEEEVGDELKQKLMYYFKRQILNDEQNEEFENLLRIWKEEVFDGIEHSFIHMELPTFEREQEPEPQKPTKWIEEGF